MAKEESCSVDCTQKWEENLREHHKDSLVQKLTSCRQTLLSMSKGGRHLTTFKTNTFTDVLIKWPFKLNWNKLKNSQLHSLFSSVCTAWMGGKRHRLTRGILEKASQELVSLAIYKANEGNLKLQILQYLLYKTLVSCYCFLIRKLF